MNGFLNNSHIKVFFGSWEFVFFLIFLMEFIVCMYVPEGMCMFGDTQETPYGAEWAGYFIHNDRHIIPKNDVLIVSSLPPD